MWNDEQGDEGWKREFSGLSDETTGSLDARWASALGGDGTAATSAVPFDHYAE